MKVGLGEQPAEPRSLLERDILMWAASLRERRGFSCSIAPLLVVGRRPRLSKTLLVVGKADLRGDVLGSEERKGVVKDNMIRAGLR